MKQKKHVIIVCKYNNNNNKNDGTTIPTQQAMGVMYGFNVEYGASSPMIAIATTFDDIMKYGDIAQITTLAINNNM